MTFDDIRSPTIDVIEQAPDLGEWRPGQNGLLAPLSLINIVFLNIIIGILTSK